MKALRGSIRVREGLRARVYVYNFSRADVSACPQALLSRFLWLERPCANAEKNILNTRRCWWIIKAGLNSRTNIRHRLCLPSAPLQS
jgi:hypothetical protein